MWKRFRGKWTEKGVTGSMTYREVVTRGEEELRQAKIAEAKNDAWLLMEAVCKIDRSFYYMHMEEDISEDLLKEYELSVNKRKEHIPLQYIVGETEFMGLKFKVNSNVLIPRQDTETLVEKALKFARPQMKILDMCTGYDRVEPTLYPDFRDPASDA